MRLLLVNWAPLWRGAEAGGGVNVHVRALAHELARRGHRVSAVNAGYSYDLTGFPRLRRPVRDGAVDCHEIVNSPVIAPGYFNLARPDLDVRAPGVEARFAKLLRRLRPEVVHFHNIEGFSGHCITLARESGARVVYSLHNYHPLCSQINLLYQNRTPCTDYRNGQRCLDCQPPPPPRWRQRLRRRALFYLRGLPGAGRWRGRIRRLAVQGPAARGAPASLHADDFRHRREQLVACLNRADLLLAVSNWVREVYVRQGVDPARVRVNTIGSPSADWPRLPDPPRAAGTPLRLVFLGMAEPHKGLPLLLDALAGMTDAELAAIDLALYARGVPALSERLGALRPRLAGLNPQDGYR
ncbi:MAG: glycosyltransferase, partial [Candidatus Competibacterales bacterium]|nr:glycosyltransferase [Candidatus Competibacterales bacterium]